MTSLALTFTWAAEISDYPATRANSAIALVRILRTGVFCNYICDAALAGSGVSYG